MNARGCLLAAFFVLCFAAVLVMVVLSLRDLG